jgi:hypothetical protein
MRVYHFTSTTGDFAPNPIRGWVMCEEAENEIEKAMRERWLTTPQALERARADERERIVREVANLHLYDTRSADYRSALLDAINHIKSCSVRELCDCGCRDRKFASSSGICHCSCHDADVYLQFPKEPEPLEKVSLSKALNVWQDDVTTAINALVDAVTDLLRRMNEISPGNRP